MADDSRSAELLQTIADVVGANPATIEAWRSERTDSGGGETPAASHGAVLLFRMVRAFRALPDGAARLQAIQYVEALAAPPSRAQ